MNRVSGSTKASADNGSSCGGGGGGGGGGGAAAAAVAAAAAAAGILLGYASAACKFGTLNYFSNSKSSVLQPPKIAVEFIGF